MDQEKVQGIADEERETARREQASRALRGEEQNDVGNDVESDV